MFAALLVAMTLTLNGPETQPAPKPAALDGLADSSSALGGHQVWHYGDWIAWYRYNVPGNCASEKTAYPDGSLRIKCNEDDEPVYCMIQVYQLVPVLKMRYFQADCSDTYLGWQDSAGTLYATWDTELTPTQYYWRLGQNLLGKAKPCHERND